MTLEHPRTITKEWLKLRYQVMDRDDYKCQMCFKVVDNTTRLEIHHIIPVRNGGSDLIDNLIILCHKCHRKVEGKYKNSTTFQCKRCDKSWTTYNFTKKNRPVVCGKCGSPYWDRDVVAVSKKK